MMSHDRLLLPLILSWLFLYNLLLIAEVRRVEKSTYVQCRTPSPILRVMYCHNCAYTFAHKHNLWVLQVDGSISKDKKNDCI